MTVNMTDLSIFTNKNENGIKLSNRLNSVLTNAKYFDALVGYFRLTGFYLLQEQLENVDEVRILIGLGTDKKTFDLLSGAEALVEVKEKVIDEFNKTEDDSIQMENATQRLIDWLKCGKVKIRMCYDKNVHAKVYIIRKNPDIIPDQFGNVITGSSNFSFNGLENNIEFNVELKNRNDVEYALEFFNELWADSKDITEDIVDTIEHDTWMNQSITPYELFLKAIFTYFEDEIKTMEVDYPWPDGYMSLQYQEDAVTQARKILANHGGVIISDVVGLGKTYIAAMLGKLLKGRKLFIVPPVVKDNWQSVLEDFGYTMKDKVVSSGIIDQIAEWDNLDDFNYVFVDEAHNFRNASTKEYDYLKRICFNKGTILITATPQNNTIADIANLITLFQDSKNSSIMPDCPDLNAYFSDKRKQLIAAKGTELNDETVKAVADDIRDNVLRHVLIRRTRSEIKKYYAEDLEKQGLTFPTLHNPKALNYMYDDEMEETFNRTIELLKQFTYARFSPLLYLKDKSLIGSNKARQENMKGFIKTMLIKRLESSIFAFLESIKRLKEGSKDFINLYEIGRIPVGALSKKENMAGLLGMDIEDYNLYTKLKEFDTFEPKDFEKQFIINVKKDDALLDEIYNLWAKYDLSVRDPKYDKLKEKLDTMSGETKVIIFSEAADTVHYLYDRLSKDYGNIVIDYTGADNITKKRYIQDNFDPKFEEKGVKDKTILVATDALSEGINLHLASTLINYDLPWNPTRVMQRTGRINRVGSKNQDLYVFNFFPRANVKEHLSLEDSIKMKISLFHELLGEDSKVITEDENVGSYELYDFLMMANKPQDEDELVSNALQMSYIQLITKIKKDNPELFNKIINLPEKIRTARVYDEIGLVTFIKQGLIKKFVYSTDDGTKEIDFETAMKMLEVKEEQKSVSMPKDYYDKLDNNKDEFTNIITQSVLRTVGGSKKESINEKKAKQYISYLLKSINLNAKDKDFVKKLDKASKKGTLSTNMYKDFMKAVEGLHEDKDIVDAIRKVIDPVYLEERTNYLMIDSLKEEKIIVLSEYLVK